MTKKERIRIAHHINALAQEVITQGATVSKMLMEDIDDKGFIGWARKVNMNATFLREQSQGARLSNWFHKAELGAGERNLSFKDLKKATQMELSRSGINEKEWDIIRKRMITDHADGISVLDPNKFDSKLVEASKNNDYNTIEKHRKIADSLYTFLHDQSHTWTPTAHTGIQAALQFASPNHPLGKIANTAAQFKSFPVASVVTLRRLYQQGLANNGVKGAALAMAQASTFLTLGGYLTLLASDAYNNRNPEDRLKGENAHTKLLAEALRAGGFGGIFADMAMSDFELSGRNLAETLVGPGLNMFSDFVGTGYGAVKDVIHSEEDEKMFKPLKITNLLSKNMPNTFGFKTLYNTFFNDILESLVDAEGTMQKAYRRQGLIESGIVQGKWFNPYE
jgi:hypothetical protein